MSTVQRNDIALAVAVCVGALISVGLSTVAGVYGAEQAPLPLAIAYCFVLSAPLALRRRYPATVAVIVCTAYFIAVTMRIPEVYAGNIAMFIAIYTVGAWSTDRRRAFIVRIAIILGMFVWLLVVTFQAAAHPSPHGPSHAGAFSPFVATMLLNLLFNALFFGGAYWFGERAYASIQQRRALEERTAELERERERSAEQAVALDRMRIARELHDIVAHHVSLMGVQAGAARAVMDSDPDAARATLTAVETSARTALDELRRLLQTLRTSDGDDADASTVGLSGIPALVEAATAAGLPTVMQIAGEPIPVRATAQLTLYRVAQEALTNARRHGGSGATADLRLRYGADWAEIEVANTGRQVAVVEAGLGLQGMRERTAAAGGTIEFGPRPGGGFLVRVRVPAGAGVAAVSAAAGGRVDGAEVAHA
ncbi:sensor histidine kinase [Microbacterium sp. ASV49]|uniref:histidine kinase n=1 Tax=Microbacterium candidum TaxID=3041922 RepID=A0ABT7MYF0_9MICO|nr:sensor histidine kinase [Microbacterium sp. ASV49]MDL9979476.1 sensor histidine kinase [Microbacterium sp. ASV49]